MGDDGKLYVPEGGPTPSTASLHSAPAPGFRARASLTRGADAAPAHRIAGSLRVVRGAEVGHGLNQDMENAAIFFPERASERAAQTWCPCTATRSCPAPPFSPQTRFSPHPTPYPAPCPRRHAPPSPLQIRCCRAGRSDEPRPAAAASPRDTFVHPRASAVRRLLSHAAGRPMLGFSGSCSGGGGGDDGGGGSSG